MADIIPGMNEIIKYINKLEIENKTLKKSIVNLCKTNNEIEEEIERWREQSMEIAKKFKQEKSGLVQGDTLDTLIKFEIFDNYNNT